jgi:uncharacterized tellurite resistance protein B-like protein
MLRTLKDLFDSLLLPQGASAARVGGDATHRLHLATAVLLVEVMRADASLGTAERASVLAALKRKFGLHEDEAARLLELAAHENHVLWRVSDLLHVPHGAYINAKMRAKAAAGL